LVFASPPSCILVLEIRQEYAGFASQPDIDALIFSLIISMKRQTAIDAHFKRSLKLKSGEIVEVKCSTISSQPVLYPCTYPGCSKQCLNPGALATYMNTHPAECSAPSISCSLFRL
jgi:hypothetical protein